MLPLLLVSGVYSVVRVQQEARARVADEHARAAGMARTIQIAVENALALRDRPHGELTRLLDDLTVGQRGIDRIRLFDRDGHVLAASNERTVALSPTLDAVARVIETGTGVVVERQGGDRAWWLYVLPVQYSDRLDPGRLLRTRVALEIAFVAPDGATTDRRAIRDVLLRVGALTVVLALLIAVVLQRQVLRPLAQLAHSIRALGEGHRGPPLPVKRRDELGELAEAFNRMTERLDEARQRVVAEGEHALDLEQQLRRAETLAVAGKLASGIAHEVGTPLNIISGRAEMVLESLPPDHPGREDLERIIQQIDRVSNIVRSLLDAVWLGKLEIQRVPVGLLIGRLLPLLEHVVRKRGIAMTTSIPETLPDVAGDPGRLQQVFINLLMNAVEATPDDGQITISAWPGWNDGRAGVLVEVTDSGAGIPPDALGQVFEPFYTTKPVGQGTGLGLAISRDIIRDHGGTVVAQSRPGQGATFTVWLPEYEALV
jgi:two-component system, NtrC family, sensor kinase